MKLVVAIFFLSLVPTLGFSQELSPATTTVLSQQKEITQDIQVPATLYILNSKIDNINIIFAYKENSIKVSWTELKKPLSYYVFPNFISFLEKKSVLDNKTKIQWISLKDLNYKGFQTKYDETDLSLKINIEKTYLKPEIISLKGNTRDLEAEKKFIRPNQVSGYMNFNMNEAYTSGNYSDPSLGRQAINVRHDGAVNVDNWALQSEGVFQEGSTYQRGDVRVVHDDVDNMVRYSAGDISIPSAGFLTSVPMMGVSANRVFSLQPNFTYTEIINYQIFLRQNGNIKIIVNGLESQTLYRTAGKYDIRDFPVLWGINSVEFFVTYDNGAIERFRLPEFNYSQDLLGKGNSQFTYAIGVPQTGYDATQNRIYNTQDVNYSVAHQYGFSNKLNGGGYLQGDENFGIVGSAFSYSTSLGLLSFENAVSHRYDGSNSVGFGTRLGYQFIKNPRSFTLNFERSGPNFYTLANTALPDPDLYKISGNYSQNLSDRTSITLSSDYGLSRDYNVASNSMDASVGINQSLSRSALFTTIVKRTIGSITEDSISFQLSWSFSPVKTLTSSYDSGTKTAESRYNTKIGDNTNEQVGVSTNPNEKQVDGQLNYIGNHGEVDVLGNSASTSGGTVNNNASINLKTAVVFAGDTWALSSPVYDSFVIVKPEGRLKDEDLVINNTVTPDFLGAMVLPNTVPYLENNININTNGLKEGLSLEHDSYTVVPTYKSGTVIKLNSESYVAIKGSLVYPNLKPYVLKSGKLTRKDNPTKFEYFFTNESGEFFIERLEAGDYILTLNDQEETKFIVNILKDSEGVLDYGELTVKDSKK